MARLHPACPVQRARVAALGAVVALGAITAQAATCPLSPSDPTFMAEGPVQAIWTTEPATPVVGDPFVMRIALCPATAQLVKVDAEMPDHRHGMNYKPSFTPMGDGRWRVEGMVWHMAGRWAVKVETRLDGTPHTLTRSVILK